jgi:hypothetical protein
MIFGSTVIHNSMNNGYEIFIVKYDKNGNILWVQSPGGASNGQAWAVTVDNDSNIIVGGCFTADSISFGSLTLHNQYWPTHDNFVVKFNASGNPIWARSSGSMYDDVLRSLCTDTLGNVYITGVLERNPAIFDSITINNINQNDLFIAKYDANGAIQWVKTAGEYDNELGTSITSDAEGNILFTGYFSSRKLIFDNDTLTNLFYNNGYSSDIFAIKCNTNGNVLWAKSFGGERWGSGNSIKADLSGNVYVTGDFHGWMYFYGDTLQAIDSAGYGDIFLVKYDINGNPLWAMHAGSYDDDTGLSLAVDHSNSVIIAGSVGATCIFDTATVSGAAFYITKYSSSGSIIWVKSKVNGYSNSINSLAIDNQDNILVAGEYGQDIVLGLDTLHGNSNYTDVLIAKLSIITGIDEIKLASKIIYIYPNPAHNTFTISLPALAGSTVNCHLSIYDVTGRVVHEQKIQSQLSTVNCQLSAGVYFVKVSDGEKGIVQKLIIE